MDLEIETRPLGNMFATVVIRIGHPHNVAIDLGTYGKSGLARLAQELEHAQDWMENTASNLKED